MEPVQPAATDSEGDVVIDEEEYRIIKAKVVGWYASTSAKRAELANRHRKNRTVEVGARASGVEGTAFWPVCRRGLVRQEASLAW